jgi:2-iminobutanoate/2-iminopropanoate deaminase
MISNSGRDSMVGEKKIFLTPLAPQPVGPYSQAVIYGSTLYISGQIPVDPGTGVLVRGTIEEETRRTLENIKIIVSEAGSTMDDVLRVSCYLSDMGDFTGFNRIYQEYFPKNSPARTTIQAAKLPQEAKIEIDAIVGMKKEV